jgi:S-adenosylmethionine decarboxylase
MKQQVRRAHALRHKDNGILKLELVRQEAQPAMRKGPAQTVAPEFWMTRGDVRCAGSHMIVDLYGAHQLDDIEHIEKTLRRCVEAANATLLHIHLHPFETNGGVSGVAVLAESHISIHSWPEVGYAALDIFMCGKARPERCIEVLLEAFTPRRVAVEEILRGRHL